MPISAKDLLRLYDGAGCSVSAYLALRAYLTPFEEIENAVGDASRVLDLACGYGLVSNFLALQKPGRVVLGLDMDPARVALAKSASGGSSRAEFMVADITAPLPDGFEAILLIDSLHYFDEEVQCALLRRCAAALRPSGRFVLREQDKDSGWRHLWTHAHEWVMTRTRMTMTRRGGTALHFLGRSRLEELLGDAGFRLIGIHPPRGPLPYSDTLFICMKS